MTWPGPTTVPFTVTSGRERVTTTATFTVLNANGAPVFDDLGGFAFRGTAARVAAFAFDPDNPAYEHPVPQRAGRRSSRSTAVPPTVTYHRVEPAGGGDVRPGDDVLQLDARLRPGRDLQRHLHRDRRRRRHRRAAAGEHDGGDHRARSEPGRRRSTAIPNRPCSRGEVLDIPVRVDRCRRRPGRARAENGMPRLPAAGIRHVHGSTATAPACSTSPPGAGDRGDHGLVLVATDDGDGGGRWARLDDVVHLHPHRRLGERAAGPRLRRQQGRRRRRAVRAAAPGRRRRPGAAARSPSPGCRRRRRSRRAPSTARRPSTGRRRRPTRGTYTVTFTVTDEGHGAGRCRRATAETITLVGARHQRRPGAGRRADTIVDEGQRLRFTLARHRPRRRRPDLFGRGPAARGHGSTRRPACSTGRRPTARRATTPTSR